MARLNTHCSAQSLPSKVSLYLLWGCLNYTLPTKVYFSSGAPNAHTSAPMANKCVFCMPSMGVFAMHKAKKVFFLWRTKHAYLYANICCQMCLRILCTCECVSNAQCQYFWCGAPKAHTPVSKLPTNVSLDSGCFFAYFFFSTLRLAVVAAGWGLAIPG